ncbi:hypothetical protein [Defluviimonas sp. WL0075]|nr:hypothetical protein [Defluviimonas sp. WL0075]
MTYATTFPHYRGVALRPASSNSQGMKREQECNPLHARVEMQYEWILDVLSDLKSFAQGNGLPELAEQLGDTSIVAAHEISRLSEEWGGGQSRDAGKVAAVRWGTSGVENA